MPHNIVETARKVGMLQTLLTAVDADAENRVSHAINRVLIPAA
jgi:uncharacterized surface protein with fasciclin (FAS1) repeats